MKKILVINVGSTSTKVAYYEDKNCVCKTNLEHPVEELSQFNSIFEQKDYRTGKVTEFCKENGLAHENVVYIGDDYGPGGNDEAVYASDFRFICVDDYTKLDEYLKEFL